MIGYPIFAITLIDLEQAGIETDLFKRNPELMETLAQRLGESYRDSILFNELQFYADEIFTYIEGDDEYDDQ